MKVLWAMLCENFVQDRNTNMLSVFNVIEEFRFLAPPPISEPGEIGQLIAYPFRLLASITRSAPDIRERGNVRVAITGPDGLTDTSAEIEVNLSDFETFRVWVDYPGLPVSSVGTYEFLLECKSEGGNWEERFEIPIQVKFGPGPNI